MDIKILKKIIKICKENKIDTFKCQEFEFKIVDLTTEEEKLRLKREIEKVDNGDTDEDLLFASTPGVKKLW